MNIYDKKGINFYHIIQVRIKSSENVIEYDKKRLILLFGYILYDMIILLIVSSGGIL